MVSVELRHIPGIGLISKGPSSEKALSLARQLLPGSRLSSSYRGIVLNADSSIDAIQKCSGAAERLSTSGFFPAFPCSLPFHGLIFDSDPPPEDIWRLIPQGALLVHENEKIPGAANWLYEWQLVNFTRETKVEETLFPLKSLMLLGDYREECFFCGSHYHKSTECNSCWSPAPQGCRVSDLSTTAPAFWTEKLKQMNRKEIAITEAIQFLLQDLRRQFSWHYIVRICQSSATSFNELATAPIRPIDTRTEELFHAINTKNKEAIKNVVDGWKNIAGDAGRHLLKGLCHFYNGEPDRAMNAWWDADNRASNSMLKACSALLQSRGYFLANNIAAAEGAASRAYNADSSPHTLYWHIIFSLLKNNRKGNQITACRLLAGAPSWLTAIAIDPLLLQQHQDIEKIFRDILSEEEELLKKRIRNLEKNLSQAIQAFGSDVTGDIDIKLRDLLGRSAEMGIAEIKRSKLLLEEIQHELNSRIHKRVSKILRHIPFMQKRCRDIIKKLPSNREKTRMIKKECLHIISALHDISTRKKITNPSHQKGLQQELAEIETKYRNMNQHYREYLETIWQLNIAKKYISWGSVFVGLVWLSFYIIRLL